MNFREVVRGLKIVIIVKNSKNPSSSKSAVLLGRRLDNDLVFTLHFHSGPSARGIPDADMGPVRSENLRTVYSHGKTSMVGHQIDPLLQLTCGQMDLFP